MRAQAVAVGSMAACGSTSAGGQRRRVEGEEAHEQITCVSARSGCRCGRQRESTEFVADERAGAAMAHAGAVEVGGRHGTDAWTTRVRRRTSESGTSVAAG